MTDCMNAYMCVERRPHKVKMHYVAGFRCPKSVFPSFTECERYLVQQLGEGTYIDMAVGEEDDAVIMEVWTPLCGNFIFCGNIEVLT